MGERVTAVEKDVEHVKESIGEMKTSIGELDGKVDKIQESLNNGFRETIRGALANTPLRTELSSKDKATVYIAIISGLVSIVIALVK